MAFERLAYSKTWEDPVDFPTYEPNENQVRADLQLLHDEARDGLNRLIDALNSPTAAAQLPFSPVGTLTAQTIQEAIEEVYAAVRDAAAGLIVDGSVTKDKLSEELLRRVYGGRLWVSMDAPTAQDGPDADLPVGQLWLRPAVTVENLAQQQWQVEGGTAAEADEGWVFTTDGTQDYMTASQLLEQVGSPGQQVLVKLQLGQCSGWLNELGVSINGIEQEPEETVFEAALDQTGSLEIQLYGQWPQSEEGEQITVTQLAVINTDALAQEGCLPCSDWSTVLEELGGEETLTLPMKVWMQTAPGQWQPIIDERLPAQRGGTGLDGLAAGSMLYGTGGEAMASLPPQDRGILQCLEGAPQWVAPGELAGSCGYLRSATGTYEGDDSSGEKELDCPEAPLFVIIWGAEHTDAAAVVPNGGTAAGSYYFFGPTGAQAFYKAWVKLEGNKLTFGHDNTGNYSELAKAQHLNRDGATYHWLAMY